MCGERGTGLDFVEAGGHVRWGFGLCADGVEVGGDVGGSWRAGVEGDVLVAGALVDGEGDEGGGHLLLVLVGFGCFAVNGVEVENLFDRYVKTDFCRFVLWIGR